MSSVLFVIHPRKQSLFKIIADGIRRNVVSSQYWNQVHGFTGEDVKKDEEGLQTMRTLGRNIVWLLQSVKCASENGMNKPEHEPKTFTNFI